MMGRPFSVICCMAAKFFRAKTRKLGRQRHLCRVTKTNFFIYTYIVLTTWVDYSLIQSFGLMSAFRNKSSLKLLQRKEKV